MPLATGLKLGPYEIVAPIGAGGMGEVYRARDPRLGRDVAVKVLPAAFAHDEERRRRFEAEARAAGSLNDPHIVTLHDVGFVDGISYLVTEILEGESLRQLLDRGPLPPGRAAGLLREAALGLSAAHAKGIIHRDLKPENLFVLRDGRLKILDFGIAKLMRSEPSAVAETTPVFASMTMAGTILGTVSYMAPEQLRDQPVDHRADLFALGAILYEMVSGKLAFPAETAADRVSAILTSEPAPLTAEIGAAMPGLDTLIRRCLEKSPEIRFESARDLAYALEALSKSAGGARNAPASTAMGIPGRELDIRQLTFREGTVSAARFAPDGATVVYRAAWEGNAPEVYLSRTDNPDYRSLQLGNAMLFAVSSTAEMLVGLDPRDIGGFVTLHTLGRVSLLGGVPRALARDVFTADWGPGGRTIGAIRQVEGRFRLEYPLGTVLHEISGWLSSMRVSPSGRLLAFFEHPVGGDNAGSLRVIEPGRGIRTLVDGLDSAVSLAWHPDEREIWFAGSFAGSGSGLLYAVDLEGRLRPLYQTLGWPDLHAISTNGQVLVSRSKPRLRMQTGTRSARGSDVELSWLDWSLARDLSADGSHILFDETGPGMMHRAAVYVRGTDGSPAVRITEGVAMAFMPNGRDVLTLDREQSAHVLAINPLGAGEALRITLPIVCHFARPFEDGGSIAVVGNPPDGPAGLYRVDVASGSCDRITSHPVGVTYPVPSPDGSLIVARLSNGSFGLFPVDGGPPRPIPGTQVEERPSRWSPDGRHLYVFSRGRIPCPVERVDVETGAREPWMTLMPTATSGTDSFVSLHLTPDGERYLASTAQYLTDLFVVGGLS